MTHDITHCTGGCPFEDTCARHLAHLDAQENAGDYHYFTEKPYKGGSICDFYIWLRDEED